MIAIIGCGTLGSRTATLLQNEELLLVDYDRVAPENLSVQKFSAEDLGKHKAEALGERLDARAQVSFIDATSIDVLREAEIVVDCTDNLTTRTLLNRWCLREGVPLIHAAAGTRTGFAGRFSGKPCLECVYGGKVSVEDCRGRDIETALADRLAKIQADLVTEEDAFFSVTADSTNRIALPTTGCPVCNGRPALERSEHYITWCTQAGCLAAKPLRRMTKKPGIEEKDGKVIETLADGEIRFHGVDDVDEAQRLLGEL